MSDITSTSQVTPRTDAASGDPQAPSAPGAARLSGPAPNAPAPEAQSPAPEAQSPAPEAQSPAPESTLPRLNLADFMDLSTLQEVQDSFTALTRLSTVIRDADGRALTERTDTAGRAEQDRVLDWLISAADGVDPQSDEADGGRFVAPIIVEGQQLGSISIEPGGRLSPAPADRQRLRQLAEAMHVPPERIDALIDAAEEAAGPSRAAGVQFLYLMANSIAQLCYQEHQLQRRVEELSALYSISTMLAGQRDLQQVLDTAARCAAEMMQVKAASIRLLDPSQKELVPKAVFNLSNAYIRKGPALVARGAIFQHALAGRVVQVHDLTSDPRAIYPEFARREGLKSMLCAGMIYQGRKVGVVQLYTGEPRVFTRAETDLLRAVAQLLAAAIANARLDEQRRQGERVQRQLRVAADVQKRMLPHDIPYLPGFDVAARYVPSFELGGDFYDFIELESNMGVAVGDVVGKGVAASLLMASVRASLRAYAQDVYDLDEIIARVNIALTRDTLDNEFATLFYGVLDPQSLRMTYCNAGHEPPLLLRDGQITSLKVGGMLVGVDATQQYEKGLLDLKAGDLMLLFTDGLVDAQNIREERFGRDRIRQALLAAAGRTDPGGPTGAPTAADVLQHVLWELQRFVGMAQNVDDTTLVVVKVAT